MPKNLKNLNADFSYILLAGLAGLAAAFYRFGWRVLNPVSVDWLLASPDLAQHYLGWLFFRNENWHFPPGMVYGYFAPIGASIGYTDSLPLLAFLFKPLDALLPVDFQYQGMWLFLSLMLQAVFGFLLVKEITPNRLLQLSGGLFFLFNPLAFYRPDNLEVRSYWLLLAALWHYFASYRSFRRPRFFGIWLGLVAMAGMIHPYLVVMVMAVAFVSILTAWLVQRRIGVLVVVFNLVGLAAVVVVEWWLTGYFTFENSTYMQTPGLGVFSTNLNAFINPTTTISRWMPVRPIREGQFDGFAYPGVGVYFLFGCGLVLAAWRRRATRRWPQLYLHIPLLLVTLIFSVYSVSNQVTWDSRVLLVLPLPDNGIGLMHTFRASGRFIWPAYLLVIFLGLWLVVHNAGSWKALALVGACLVIQIGDMSVMKPDHYADFVFFNRLSDPRWEQVIAPFERIVPMPPFSRSIFNWPEEKEDPSLLTADYKDFSYLAATHGKQLSSGYLARVPENEVAKQQKAIENRLRSGHPAPEYLYIFTAKSLADNLARFKRLRDALRCHALDGYLACYSSKLQPVLEQSFDMDDLAWESLSLLDFLQRYRQHIIVMVVRDGTSYKLGQEVADYLSYQGSQISHLGFQDSYILVLYDGQVIFEKIDPDQEIIQSWPAGARLVDGIALLPQELYLDSAGYTDGHRPSSTIQLGDAQLALEWSGINVVVFDSQWNLLVTANFGALETEQGLIEKFK